MNFIQLGISFKITGRGYVYKCNFVPGSSNVRIGDKFYDCVGNEFIIKGFEMVRMLGGNPIYEGRWFVLISSPKSPDLKVIGKILSSDKEINKISFIYPSNPLDFKEADFDYMDEYYSINNTFSKMLFSYEELVHNHKLKIDKIEPGIAIYRGWMLKPEQYEELIKLLAEKNIYLINSIEDYERCQLLPNWYSKVEKMTPKSCWTKSNNINEAYELLNEFDGPIMVKDYVKSRKHEWDDACYIENPKTSKAKEVIRNFITRQETEFVGGTVLREFVDLKSRGYHEISGMPIFEEYRIFVLYDEIISIIDYWGNNVSKLREKDMNFIQNIMNSINSNFYTIDIARNIYDDLIIIEIGDGQVSGLQGFNENEFYELINNILRNES